MIDLHSHILPGIDDGPANMEESVSAAQRAREDGVRTVAATPHVREDHPRVRPAELAPRCETLRKHLAEAGVDIAVVPGGEVDLAWAGQASDQELQLVSYGQRGLDLLVETPYGPLPTTFEDLLFSLQARGYRILLAHPERNPTLKAEPERLEALVARGVLVQVTAKAFAATGSRTESQRLAVDIVERGLAHVIASDSHGRAIQRTPLSEAVAIAEKRIGERARWMVTEAPAAIIAGEVLEAGPSPARRRRRFLRRS
jgi:protein-tyrosine phosphatase